MLDLLNLDRLDATTGGPGPRTGGQLQQLPTPGSDQVFTTPAVTTIGGRPHAFVADNSGTAAYVLSGANRLSVAWHDGSPGTSPVLAGGLLYVYDQRDGHLIVRSPVTGQALISLSIRNRSLEQPDRGRRAHHPARGQLHDSFLCRRARHLAFAGALTPGRGCHWISRAGADRIAQMNDAAPPPPSPGASVILERGALDALLATISRAGYHVIGPTVKNGAIVYGDVHSAADFPVGWGDEQDGGSYRLRRRDDEAVFGYAVGPQSWKQFLHPPRLRLWRARRGGNGDGLEIIEEPAPESRYAFIGVRSCELHAIAIQDRVFLPGTHPDLSYAARREDVLFVAVNCGEPSGTCFCASMNTGPKASSGYDLALTELLDGQRHEFLVEIGSERGAGLIDDVPHRVARATDVRDAAQVSEVAVTRMGREMPQVDLRALLYEQLRAPALGRGR